MTAGPATEEERRRGLLRIGAGFAAVVGLSAGTSAYFSGATSTQAAAAVLAGGLVGAVLLFLVVR